MPEISVIVPVYNAEKYLYRCIDSILEQTFTNFELLLVDDGSSDNSGIICDEYACKDSRIRVFHKENGGVSSARNIGLDYARGNWIAFVDSDDYVYPSFLATYMDLCNNGVDLCILGVVPDYSLSVEYKITKASIDYIGDLQSALFLFADCQMFGALWNKLLKKSIIEEYQLRLNEEYKYREDEEFLLRYMLHVKKIASTIKEEYVYIVPSLYKYNNINNLHTIISMYSSIVNIYRGSSNVVTDSYQIELCNEWLTLLKSDTQTSFKQLPLVLRAIGWRIFRIRPFKTFFCKIYDYIRK